MITAMSVYICLLCLQMSTTLSSSSTLSQCHEMEATWYPSAINIIWKHGPYQTLIPPFPKTNLQVANCCFQKRYGHGLGTKWFHHHTHGPASEFLIEEGTGGGCWANSHSPGLIQGVTTFPQSPLVWAMLHFLFAQRNRDQQENTQFTYETSGGMK